MFDWKSFIIIDLEFLCLGIPFLVMVLIDKFNSYLYRKRRDYENLASDSSIVNSKRKLLERKAKIIRVLTKWDLFTEDCDIVPLKVITYWVPMIASLLGVIIMCIGLLATWVIAPCNVNTIKGIPETYIEKNVENPIRKDCLEADKFNERVLDDDNYFFIKKGIKEEYQEKYLIDTEFMWAKYLARVGKLSEAIEKND